jgi:glycosyltransferase involved in cell wall biosynthesis
MEAMSSGKPVIACNPGGAPDAVLHDKAGLLVPSQDANVLATALFELCHNDKRRRTLGRVARAWEKERFSITSYLDRVKRIYKDLVQQ